MNPTSLVLVLVQISLIIVVLSPIAALFDDGLTARIGQFGLAMGTALALWAVLALKLRNFSVMPEPVRGGELCRRGPYRQIRHPIYTSVLISCTSAWLIHATPVQLIALVALVLVLLLKIRREERLLVERFPEYEAYRRTTSALIPGLF